MVKYGVQAHALVCKPTRFRDRVEQMDASVRCEVCEVRVRSKPCG